MNRNNKQIIAVSGVAGSGKGSVWGILKEYPEKFCFSVSYTSRAKREGEVDDREYRFITGAEFDKAIDGGEFLEWENVHLDKYGTKKKDFEELLSSGKIVMIEIDVKGAKNLLNKFENVLTIFITTPNLESAMERLEKRGTENKKSLEKRISRYNFEMEFAKEYDYIIVNDDLGRAQKELLEIVNRECG
jgi:guanylate kinase